MFMFLFHIFNSGTSLITHLLHSSTAGGSAPPLQAALMDISPNVCHTQGGGPGRSFHRSVVSVCGGVRDLVGGSDLCVGGSQSPPPPMSQLRQFNGPRKNSVRGISISHS